MIREMSFDFEVANHLNHSTGSKGWVGFAIRTNKKLLGIQCKLGLQIRANRVSHSTEFIPPHRVQKTPTEYLEQLFLNPVHNYLNFRLAEHRFRLYSFWLLPPP